MPAISVSSSRTFFGLRLEGYVFNLEKYVSGDGYVDDDVFIGGLKFEEELLGLNGWIDGWSLELHLLKRTLTWLISGPFIRTS